MKCLAEMESVLGIDPLEVLPCSGKTGQGVDELLEAIVERVPPPAGDPGAPLQAMVFDSHYDEFRGAITYVRIMNGTVPQGPEDPLLENGHHLRSARAGPIRPAAPPLRPSCRPGRSAI